MQTRKFKKSNIRKSKLKKNRINKMATRKKCRKNRFKKTRINKMKRRKTLKKSRIKRGGTVETINDQDRDLSLMQLLNKYQKNVYKYLTLKLTRRALTTEEEQTYEILDTNVSRLEGFIQNVIKNLKSEDKDKINKVFLEALFPIWKNLTINDKNDAAKIMMGAPAAAEAATVEALTKMELEEEGEEEGEKEGVMVSATIKMLMVARALQRAVPADTQDMAEKVMEEGLMVEEEAVSVEEAMINREFLTLLIPMWSEMGNDIKVDAIMNAMVYNAIINIIINIIIRNPGYTELKFLNYINYMKRNGFNDYGVIRAVLATLTVMNAMMVDYYA